MIDFKEITSKLEHQFTDLILEQPEKIENQTDFINRMQAGIDPDTGSIQVNHGLSPDMVAFENCCRVYDTFQP